MIRFDSDYMAGAHPRLLDKLVATNLEQTSGYGTDHYTAEAAELIKKCCNAPDARVQFLIGGTQSNATVIDGLLARHEGVLAAESGHINVHEAGAIEASGHKVLTLPHIAGKICASDVEHYIREFYADDTYQHMVAPGMLYISHPTEFGTIYSLAELEELSKVCHNANIPLYIDGARLAYGLAAESSDVTLEDIARLADVFYIGGTKVGALFGEAVVFKGEELLRSFRYAIKQHGGMLAKGRLLGIQFEQLLKGGDDCLYFRLARHANSLAKKISAAFGGKGIPMWIQSQTNMQFPILTKEQQRILMEKYVPEFWCKYDEGRDVVRFCTSWATKEENVEQLCKDIEELL